ncbi:MAG: class IV adenylate cyclase [Chloroflexi bacterium]|nr:class IV adenylate cyclase [Chloroflexota bacterium]
MSAIYNIELKARIADLTEVERVVRDSGAVYREKLIQEDHYFKCDKGRLKLRLSQPPPDELIFYKRPDVKESRESTGCRVEVDGKIFLPFLKSALEEKVVVRKERILYLLDNVRIHLDKVEGAGYFIEMEAVIESEAEEESAHSIIGGLAEKIGIKENDLIAGSYSDMA